MVFKFFKKSAGGGIKNEITQNQQLAEELHKPIIKKFRKGKVYPNSTFKYNIWSAGLADVQLIKDLINEIGFYYVLLICLVNMHGLFL